ncbi:MAG: YfhO family protein, partial [Acidobacteria bacterium]|nr:YfhO family protein [Acidobacteriota bacterium]
RYNDVFGAGWHFASPELAAARDPQVMKPEFKGFDLLNVRYSEWFAASLPSSIRYGEARFAAQDTGVIVPPRQTQTLHAHALPANRLTLVTILVNAAARKTGEPFARMKLFRADDSAIERTLQVGLDSADFSFGHKDANIRHQSAQLFDILPGNAAHRFWMQHSFDTTMIDRLEIENLTEDVTIYLTRASLYDESKAAIQALAPRLPDWRKVYDHDGVQLYENPRVLPRVWLTDRVRHVTPAEALQAVRGAISFDPRAETLLERDATPAFDERFQQRPQARITNYSAHRLTIETEADANALLTISERYASGWRATIDGQTTPVLLANYFLRGIYVPKGKHRIEMHYAAPAAWRGLWISLSAALIFGILLRLARKRAW